jgi:hypothetical protein
MYKMNKLFTRYLPIPYRIFKDTKVRLLRDSLRTLQYIIQAAVYYNPLKLFMECLGIAIAGVLRSVLFWPSPRLPRRRRGGRVIGAKSWCWDSFPSYSSGSWISNPVGRSVPFLSDQ